MRAVSAKRARLLRERRKTLEQLADTFTGRVCARCFSAPAQDAHELLSRARGGSIVEIENIVALCRRCHDWITTHPAEATEQGWLISQYRGRV